MNKIVSLKLKYKMAILLSVPILGMIFIAQSKISKDLTALNESTAVTTVTQLGVTASQLIHELQKEREISSSYMASQGRSIESEMHAQRSNVDQRIDELHLHLDEMDVESFGIGLSEQLNTAVEFLEELPEKRDAIVDLTISSPVAFGYYSAINAAFLDMISYTARLSPTGATSRAAAAHVNLMRGKDRAGIERAVMNTTFANDAFDPGMYDIFIGLVSAQDTYFSVFNELATDEQRQYAQATLQGTFIDETEAMRETVTDLGDFGGYGVDADRWFRMQTGKIDLFKNVEDRLASDLLEIANTNKAAAKSALVLSLVQVAIVILATAVLGYIISRAVTRPLRRCVEIADSIASGNLNNEMASTSSDEIGQLLCSLDTMQTNLREVVGNIQSTATAVNTGADEMSQGNANLSQRTEEQALSLEATASNMEEMTSTVKQNADNAGEANQLAMAAREQAEKGGAVVSQAVEAMNEINAASKKIADIIGVIDEIAFQTNLLALNASVEAARAGDQGRGFAVVASEVRNLAGRSATAAKEIKELIVDSGAKVDEGSRLVNESGETLQEIVNGVMKVTDIVGEIAAASSEQSAGIDQVNKAIVQLVELTQQNAALVEEAAAASESMGEQADDLNQMMTFFTIDHTKQVDVAASDGSPPGGVEQRSANRPWTVPKTAETIEKVAAPAPQRKAATSILR